MSSPATTSDEILASARAFIIGGGYNAFSYADISAVVGIRKPSIHHHFPTKAGLVRTLVRQYREAAEAGLTDLAATAPSPLAALERLANLHRETGELAGHRRAKLERVEIGAGDRQARLHRLRSRLLLGELAGLQPRVVALAALQHGEPALFVAILVLGVGELAGGHEAALGERAFALV